MNFADPGLWLSCGLFFANHLYSYLSFRGQGPRGSDYMNEQFFSPYARIIPMHLTIIFGAILLLVLQALGIMTTLPVLVLFLLLKTRMDVSAHLRKHGQEKNPDAPVQFF